MKKLLAVILTSVMIISCFSLFASASVFGQKKQSDEWKAMVLENYNEFISEVDGDNDKIPFIVSTDQHGAVKSDSEIYSYINGIVDWNKVSKIINLGDTVQLMFNPVDLISYRHATACLPEEKRIEVIGNHDRVPVIFGTLVEKLFFPNKNAVRSCDGKAFVIEDEQFNIRYLTIDPTRFPWYYTCGAITTSQADFIINELSKNDSSDIVMLSHPYLFRDAVNDRFGGTFTGSENFIGTGKLGENVKQSFIEMLAARKNKTAGVFIDSLGKKHPYDFTNCESDFLMTLHGHHHSEGYEKYNGITEFLFQSMTKDNKDNNEPDCFYFAYIDRNTKTFKCWKNVAGYDAWEISID